MTKEEALKKAEAWGKKQEWPYDVVRYAGEKNGWHFVHLDRSVRPRYIGFGMALKISPKGRIVKSKSNMEICLIARASREILNGRYDSLNQLDVK